MNIKRNMNRIDQMARLVVGLASIYFGFIDNSFIAEPVIAICLGIFGIINLFSVATLHCPVYHMAGINTAPDKHA